VPYMHDGKRDYKREYAKYAGKPDQIHNRALRNKARRRMMEAGRVSKGDGKDIDHIKPISQGGSNAPSNTRVQSASANRSFRRTSSGKVA
jgi:hypothetical protein